MTTPTEQLPAYLRRRLEPCPQCGVTGTVHGTETCPRCNGRGGSPTGPLELVMHCTWAQDYDLCGEKFNLRYGVQVEASGPKCALTYGAAVHAALAVWARGGGK